MEASLQWIAEHPIAALVVLFLACAIEGFFVIGIVIPGALIMFGIGALVALGALDFWVCVFISGSGALLGDTLTFLIGRRYGAALFALPILARYPEVSFRGQRFFQRHGGKSLILGRFIGPLRPIMPAVAGAYQMRWNYYLLIELVSAYSWAVVYLAPGVVFGASLGLASEVATRMVVLLLVIVIGIWFLFFLVRRCVMLAQRHGERWVLGLLDWSSRHRRLGRLGGWLADPNQPETPGLAILAVILLAASWLVLYAWWGIGAVYPAAYDALAWQTLRDFYTPAIAFLATAIALLGEAPVYVPVFVAVLVSLLWRRRNRAAAHWIAAVSFAALISMGLYYLLPLPEPVRYFGGEAATRFSGRDLILATVIYGFIPVLLATRRLASIRAWMYGVAVSLIALITAAQIYLGIQWLSVAAFSVSLGAIWVLILALGYRRHRAERVIARHLLLPTLLVFGAACTLSWQSRLDERVQRYAPHGQHQPLQPDQWWKSGFAQLPAYRIDIAGRTEQPLNLQWAGQLEEIQATLMRAGWQQPLPMTWANSLRLLTVTAGIQALPILPQVHRGRHQSLIMHRLIDDQHQWVLRLWATDWQLPDRPIWIGSVTRQQVRPILGLLRYPATINEFSSPPVLLDISQLPGFDGRLMPHPEADQNRENWSGSVWLLRSAPTRPDPDS